LSTFAELGVSAPLIRCLARRAITHPFEVQQRVLPDALAGRDVLAKSRTGSGKTLAFAVPIVERVDVDTARPAALVLVPTRELAVQVTAEMSDLAAARNLRVAPVYGGVAIDKQANRARKAHVIVATPGRLWDLLNRKLISVGEIGILVLDEADRMLDMGFQPQVDRIVRRLPEKRQTMFFSATLDGVVGHLARAYTTDPVRHEVAEERPTVEEAEHRFIPVDEHSKLDRLVGVLKEDRGLALIFVRTKRGADRLRIRLGSRGVEALSLHGDMTQVARARSLERFAAGGIDVLVATDVAARGLDLDGITHVINYDPPRDYKDYVHRVGRTARAGRTGTGVTFVAASDRQDLSAIASALKLKDEFQSEGLTLAPPRRVYSSRGSRSMMRPRVKRRF
jgi:ATP-dependent RNA helicase RhlE